jgi:uncharacterized protein YukE
MVQSTAGRIFDVGDLEREIEAEVRNRTASREPRSNLAAARTRTPAPSMPEYVVHREGASEIGRLSAEAVVREYEAAAKEIEAMGAELIERVKQCETMTRDAVAATNEMKETAKRYREEAKRIFMQIEDCSLMTAEVRKTCTALKARIAAPPTAPA